MTHKKHIYLSGKGVRQHMLSKKLKLVVSGIVAAVIVAATISTSYAATIYTQKEAGARYTRYATYNTFTMAAGAPKGGGGSFADRGTYGMFRGDGLTDSSAVPVRTDVHYYNADGSSTLDWYNSNFVYCIHNRKLSPSATYYPEIGFGSVASYVDSSEFRNDSAMKDAVTRNGVLIILQNGFPVTDFGMPRDDAYSATAMAIRFWMAERERDLNASGVWTYLWNYNVYDVSRSETYGSIAAISSYATLARNQAALSQAHALLGLARKAKSGYGTRAPSTLSASGGSAYISGSNFVFTTALNYSNLDSISWTSNLPAGSNIYRDGNTLVATVPKSVSYANKSYRIDLQGYDKAHVNNFVFAPITTNNAYQALVGISGTRGRYPVVESALTFSTPSIETDLVPSIRTYSMKTGAKVYTNTFEPGERVYVELITTNTDAPTAYNFSNWWSWKNNATGGLVNEHAATVSTLAGYGNTHVVAKSYVPPIRDASYTSTIGYQVDYNDAVAERNNTTAQNTASHTVTIKGRPNLNVTQVRTINSSSNEQNSYNPTIVAADRKVRAGIVVRNNGASTSAATTATLTLNGVTKTVNIPAIASGGTATVYVAAASAHDTPRPNATTNYTVTGTVAAGQTYSGSRTASKTISVIGKPNLNVTQVRTINSSSSEQNSYNPTVVAADRKVRAGIVVKNNGASTSAATTATLTLNGVTKTVNIPAIAAGASKTVYVAAASAHDTPRPNATTNYTVTGTVAAGQTYSGSRTASKSISVIGKPDLDITALSTNKTTYNPGETVTVTTNVRNKGYSTSAATTMTLKLGTTSKGTKTVPALAASKYWGSQTFTFTAPSPNTNTSYTVNVSIPTGQSPTGTTSRTVNITVRGRADLDITSLSANKSTYNAGEPIVISTNVRNKGFSTSAQSAMTFKIEGVVRETRTIPALAASGTWGTQTFSFTAPAASDNKAYAINVSIPSNQSPTGTISRTISVTVLGLPDLAVVESTAQNYFADKDVVISALVRNYNPIAVPEAEVKLTFAGRNLIEKIPIPASGSNRAVFRIRTPVNPGEYAITIAADPDNKINETNNANNVLTQTVTVSNENRVPMPDPDSPSLEQYYMAQGKTLPGLSLPAYQRRHSWQEIRLESGSYVTRTYWMQLDTVFSINPDPRVAIPGKPDLIESGFGIESNAEMVITTNYDRPDKLVGPQMVYLFYPEAAYGKLPFANYADSLEILNGTKGAHNSLWHYPISPFSLTGSRLHYTPLWTPDGSYDVMAQSFYAWSPVGQMYDFKSDSVTIEGDMYDRVTVVRR